MASHLFTQSTKVQLLLRMFEEQPPFILTVNYRLLYGDTFLSTPFLFDTKFFKNLLYRILNTLIFQIIIVFLWCCSFDFTTNEGNICPFLNLLWFFPIQSYHIFLFQRNSRINQLLGVHCILILLFQCIKLRRINMHSWQICTPYI